MTKFFVVYSFLQILLFKYYENDKRINFNGKVTFYTPSLLHFQK